MMKTATRFALIGICLLLCAIGVAIANRSHEKIFSDTVNLEPANAITVDDGCRYASSSAQPKLTFQQLEAIIRKDPTAKQQHGKIEFGSVRLDQGTAFAEVMFVSDDGRVLPLLYKLLAERNSWKIVNVQRIWYVPRSHLLRGVRA
jgi:uncharacterized protein DUF4864